VGKGCGAIPGGSDVWQDSFYALGEGVPAGTYPPRVEGILKGEGAQGTLMRMGESLGKSKGWGR